MSPTPPPRPADAHAAPHRDRVRLPALWAGLFAGPLLWGAQTLANYAVVAHGCYPTSTPRATPTFGVWGLAVAVSVVAALGTAAAGAVALRSWRATREETGGPTESLLDTAEGRTRFMAMTGLVLSGLFLLAVLATGLPLFMVRPCA
ncbi:hypothetical protein tb265_21330 [Gemmatimonadetes bacterium T265]|nr:hypothetical protein tb265_21330 [Gemmatimonadetes bacterium T265]